MSSAFCVICNLLQLCSTGLCCIFFWLRLVAIASRLVALIIRVAKICSVGVVKRIGRAQTRCNEIGLMMILSLPFLIDNN